MDARSRLNRGSSGLELEHLPVRLRGFIARELEIDAASR